MSGIEVFDIVIAGAGIAGVSLAAALPADLRICILEMEAQPAYHTTARSAAVYMPNYGPAAVLAATRASAAFFHTPLSSFAAAPLITKRSTLFLEAEGQASSTSRLLSFGAALEELTEAQLLNLCPILRPGYARRAFLDPNTGDIDVDLLFAGFLRQAKAKGVRVVTSAEIIAGHYAAGQWRVETQQGLFSAQRIVNAAGAWGDVVAQRLQVKELGLIPKRRSIGVTELPLIPQAADLPMMNDVGETWYAKPQSGKLIFSSADVTPVEPHDAYADDMALAEGAERLMQATTMTVERLEHSWGGLRTFTRDGSLAVGYDTGSQGFFWLVGQGGYGIQSAPALSRIAAALLMTEPLPGDVLEAGFAVEEVDPARFV